MHQTALDIGGQTFAYQYLQGLYKPYFDNEWGAGTIFLSPFRHGEKWDPYNEPDGRLPLGFYGFEENHLLIPKVFGIGKDPIPPNMRYKVSEEEWCAMALHTKEKQAQYFKNHEM